MRIDLKGEYMKKFKLLITSIMVFSMIFSSISIHAKRLEETKEEDYNTIVLSVRFESMDELNLALDKLSYQENDKAQSDNYNLLELKEEPLGELISEEYLTLDKDEYIKLKDNNSYNTTKSGSVPIRHTSFEKTYKYKNWLGLWKDAFSVDIEAVAFADGEDSFLMNVSYNLTTLSNKITTAWDTEERTTDTWWYRQLLYVDNNYNRIDYIYFISYMYYTDDLSIGEHIL